MITLDVFQLISLLIIFLTVGYSMWKVKRHSEDGFAPGDKYHSIDDPYLDGISLTYICMEIHLVIRRVSI